jgi:hypothetical protein
LRTKLEKSAEPHAGFEELLNTITLGEYFMKVALGPSIVAGILVVLLGLLPSAFAQSPVPFVNLPLVPGAVTPGSAGFTLTVNGTGFVNSSTVNWNGVARATTFASSSQLTATILAADVANASTASVTVSTPGGGTSNVAFFEITNPVSVLGFAKSDVTVGTGPDAIVEGDFNADGKMDLAVVNPAGTVSILLGNGDGTFQPHVDYATGTGPVALKTGDFDGDGSLDLAVVNSTANTVSILLNNGNGTFQAKHDYATGTGTQNPQWIAVADFNGDGNLDLAVANMASNTISILLGNGEGSFALKSSPSVATGPVCVEVGDFDGDGKLDLVVASATGNSLSVLLGNGDGTFQAGQVIANIKATPHSVTVGDFNGDGILDVAISNEGSETTLIGFGKGDGTFQTPLQNYSTGIAPSQEVAADLNGDGFLDLITNNQSPTGTFSYLINNGNGTFQFHNNNETGTGPLGLTVGDFNNDGMLDLAVAASTENTGGAASVMLQVPAVTISPASLTFLKTPVETTSSGQNVTIQNNTNKSISITQIVMSGDFAETGSCKGIPSLGTCTISVTFTPTAVGTRTGSVSITDSLSTTPIVVGLTGTGIPQVVLSPATFNFGNQVVNTTSAVKQFRLVNNLTTTVTISSIAASVEFGQTNNCGGSLAGQGACTISVTFTPTKVGLVAGSLSVTDSAVGSPQTSALKGKGIQ